MLAGLWAGLLRIGWSLPPIHADLAGAHGPLMVAGFLGVVIGLERAVALAQRWAFAAPALAGAGAMVLVSRLPVALAAGLFVASSMMLLAIFACFFRLRPEWPSALLGVGAAAWLVGNGLWLGGVALTQVTPWWAGFLVLTIAGERLELAQGLRAPRIRLALLAATGLITAGLLLAPVAFSTGVQLAGGGLLALAGWLLRYDVARRTVRRAGLPRFSAVCLLLGYLWLGLTGLLWLLGPGGLPGTFWYDAMVHTLFVGFAFSMIFAHAPTIVPAVTGVAVPFRHRFYLHVGVLHGSLLLRLLGDLLPLVEARRWGGLLNALAIVLFILLTVGAARGAARPTAIRTRPDG